MQMYERYGKELTDLFNGFANIIEKDYVSKDKIKDKIKELKKECVDCRYRKMLNCKNQCTIGGTIKVLKELLNKEE